MATEIARQALYDLVWSKAKTQVAKDLGFSDVALGKICKKANIPVPPRGYWRMRDAQQHRVKIALPVRGLGQNDTVTIGPRRSWWSQEPNGELPPPPQFSEPIDSVIQRAQQLAGKVIVPRSLESPHHLVAKLLEEDEQRRHKVAESRYYWDKPRFEAPAARRRLRLINAIFLALSKAGFRPDYRGNDADELYAHVGDQVIKFAIEPVQKGKHQDRMFAHEAAIPRLPLLLSIESHVACPPGITKEWQDTEKLKLESVLSDVVVSILVFGELRYRAHAIHHHEWLVQRKLDQEEAVRKAKELAERQILEARLKWEQERRDRLFSHVKYWKRAADIRDFVAAVRGHQDPIHHPKALEVWAEWAISEADAIDPLCGSLGDVFKVPDGQTPESED